MIKFLKDKQGQAAIIFVLVFILLFGFIGLAFDVGHIVYQKQRMQNALDLSLLAGTQEVPKNKSLAVQTTKDFWELNGFERGIIIIHTNYQGDTNKVYAQASKTINLLFMPILGIDTKTITVSATTEIVSTSLEKIFDYAIFSANEHELFGIGGADTVVDGDVHVNSMIEIGGSDSYFNNVFECNGHKSIHELTYFGNLDLNSDVLPMVTYDMEELREQATKLYTGDTVFSDTEQVNDITYVDGEVSISASNITGRGTIVATGNISISGNELRYLNPDDVICFYSAGECIEISGNDTIYEGTFYAPNGYIKIGGNNNIFYGSLIADYFDIGGSGNHFIYDSKIKEIMGGEMRVRLIE